MSEIFVRLIHTASFALCPSSRCYCGASVLLLIALCSGCSRGPKDRVLVTGEVTYGGAPVEDGLIRFQPIGNTVGNISVAMIVDGKYRAEGMGGVPRGSHRVDIRAFDPSTRSAGPGPSRAQLLPDKYNKQSQLTVELTGDAIQVVQDFHLDR
jgi:hypothetical protein